MATYPDIDRNDGFNSSVAALRNETGGLPVYLQSNLSTQDQGANNTTRYA